MHTANILSSPLAAFLQNFMGEGVVTRFDFKGQQS
jgi:hypothetical protein